MTIQEKLIQFEKYLKRQKFNPSYQKSNVLWRFHEIFMEEMKGTETGDKWRKEIGIK